MKDAPFRLVFFFSALLLLGLVAGAISLPFSFQAGDVIKAEEVNANFDAVATAVDTLNSTIPGASNASAPERFTSVTTETEVASITVDVPADGYIDLASSGWININHNNGNTTEVWVGLVENLSEVSTLVEGTGVFNTPSALPSDTYQTPFSVSRLIPATAGTHTYYLAAYRYQGTGSTVVGLPSLRAVYYPASYAATANLAATDAQVIDGEPSTTR